MTRPRTATGLDWLGSIPTDWNLVPLGRVFRERKTTVSDADYAPLSVSMAGIVPRMENVALTASGDNRKLVRSGDYVINSRSDRKGSGGLSASDGSVSVISTVLRPTGIEPRFAHHLLRSTGFQEEFYRWGSGIVADLWSTRYDKMSKITLPLPPLREQRAIADFLDRETAKIEALIEKQDALIERLRERRAAVIESVIAVHAPVAPLGYYVRALPGYAFPSGGFNLDDEGIRLLRGVNIKPDGIDWQETVHWPESRISEVERYLLVEGDVVLGLDRPFVAGGTRVVRLAARDTPSLLLQRVVKLIPRGLASDFLLYLLQSRAFREYAEPEFTGVSVPHLSDKQVREFRVPIPSLQVQSEVASTISTETTKIDTLIAKAERFVELARERRSALITAAVTGQMDIEGAA